MRLVYVPARSVGNYGGEVDNWRWPRHTGDFAFFRAYVGKDGKPADHAADNVPYRPKHFLKVSDQGVRASDFVMVAGFPGTHDAHQDRARGQARRRVVLPVLHRAREGSATRSPRPTSRRRARPRSRPACSSSASRTGSRRPPGCSAGLTSGDLLQRKAALDQQVAAWAGAARARGAHGGDRPARAAGPRRAADRARRLRPRRRVQRLAAARGRARADAVGRRAARSPTPSASRATSSATCSPRSRRTSSSPSSSTAMLDRALFRLALVRALELPPAERTWLPVLLGARPTQRLDAAFIDKTLDAWYRATKLDRRAAPARAAAERHAGAARGVEGSVPARRTAGVVDLQGRGAAEPMRGPAS